MNTKQLTAFAESMMRETSTQIGEWVTVSRIALDEMARETLQAIKELKAAERERDELEGKVNKFESYRSIKSKLFTAVLDRAKNAEAELARRDAATGEPVAWQYRYNDGKVGDWHTVDSESECNHHPFYERRPIYSAAPPAVLPPEKPVVFGSDLCQDIENYGYNLALADTRQLGAQQQKVVELPDPADESLLSTWQFNDSVINALDAAGVKWEVKK